MSMHFALKNFPGDRNTFTAHLRQHASHFCAFKLSSAPRIKGHKTFSKKVRQPKLQRGSNRRSGIFRVALWRLDGVQTAYLSSLTRKTQKINTNYVGRTTPSLRAATLRTLSLTPDVKGSKSCSPLIARSYSLMTRRLISRTIGSRNRFTDARPAVWKDKTPATCSVRGTPPR